MSQINLKTIVRFLSLFIVGLFLGRSAHADNSQYIQMLNRFIAKPAFDRHLSGKTEGGGYCSGMLGWVTDGEGRHMRFEAVLFPNSDYTSPDDYVPKFTLHPEENSADLPSRPSPADGYSRVKSFEMSESSVDVRQIEWVPQFTTPPLPFFKGFEKSTALHIKVNGTSEAKVSIFIGARKTTCDLRLR